MNDDTRKLQNLVLAPWIIKATALIGIHRNVGGNQFRHGLATMAILLDYKYFDDYILLKASVVHDLLEDIPDTNEYELRRIDDDADKVVDLVKEVTRRKDQSKIDFLKGLLEHGSFNAKILKVADRISNLTDLHRDHYPRDRMSRYLDQTEQYVLPMAVQVNNNMTLELYDLIKKRRQQLNYLKYPGFIGI
jgi:(p)ppGpp synthase/HD superfamily hydrolase